MQFMPNTLPMFSFTLNETDINVFDLGYDKDSQQGEKIYALIEDGKWQVFDESNLPMTQPLSGKVIEYCKKNFEYPPHTVDSLKHYFLLQELNND